MATLTHFDESLVENDEIFYPHTDMIDIEPFYKNVTVFHNNLQQDNSNTQIHVVTNPWNDVDIITCSSDEDSSNELNNTTYQNIYEAMQESKFNLESITEESDYKSQQSHIDSSLNQSSFSSESNRISRSIMKTQMPNANQTDYMDSLSDRRQNLTSRNVFQPINDSNENSTKEESSDLSETTINQSSFPVDLRMEQADDKYFKSQIGKIYGVDTMDTISEISSQCSSVLQSSSIEQNPTQNSTQLTVTDAHGSISKQRITIREYYTKKETSSVMVNRSSSSISSQQTANEVDNSKLINDHQKVNHDSCPEIIKQPNPNQVCYRQNITIRYLIPPTPPAPGPLIVREIIPPRPQSPSPLIIQENAQEPLTPSPCIIREAPPTPPVYENMQIFTKMVGQENPSSQTIVLERTAPLPPKPQPIIIEKWLPYKQQYSREAVYENTIDAPLTSSFQTCCSCNKQQHTHTANYHSTSSTPFSYSPNASYSEQQTSFVQPENSKLSALNHLTCLTQQQLEFIERQTLENIQAHQQWMDDQRQEQSVLACTETPFRLTTPVVVINRPPVIRLITSYVHRRNIPQQPIHQSIFMYPAYA